MQAAVVQQAPVEVGVERPLVSWLVQTWMWCSLAQAFAVLVAVVEELEGQAELGQAELGLGVVRVVQAREYPALCGRLCASACLARMACRQHWSLHPA